MHLSIQITLAALSIMGFYFLLKIVSSLLFASKHIAAAVMINDKKQLRELDLLLDDASAALFAIRHRRLAVFVPSEIWANCDDRDKKLSRELADEFGAEFYII